MYPTTREQWVTAETNMALNRYRENIAMVKDSWLDGLLDATDATHLFRIYSVHAETRLTALGH